MSYAHITNNSDTRDLHLVFPSKKIPDCYRQQLQSSMDEPETPHSCLKPSNQKLLGEYQEIGKLLLVCEAALYCVGIPWLPPSAEIRKRISQYEGPLDDFVRLSLVTVSTQTLECYVSDMGASELQDAEALCIPMPGLLQRYSLAVMLSATFFAANCLIHNAFGNDIYESLFTSTVVAVVAATLGCLVVSEMYRRRSFMILLSKELDRRRGMLGGQGTSVSAKIENEPVPD